MYKLSIVNEVNGRTFGSTWESKEEKDQYLKEQIAKGSWGKPGEYTITETNLNLSKTYRNEQKKALRKAEYPTIEEILHVILDHGTDSPEMESLQAKRAAIKAKYKLEK